MSDSTSRRRSAALAIAVTALLAQAAANATTDGTEQGDPLTQIIVTATRRAESVQDVPINISALSGETIAALGVGNLTELSRSVPGLFIRDQGGRGANQIVVRGLNADPVASSEAINNDGGGTVATYVGEIPFYIDMALEDIERVEVLLGPQGTLYGAGTLGGAVRYIPRRPQLEETSFALRASSYALAQSDGYGGKGGITVNLPISETLAFRASVDYEDDPGFIDYNYLVRVPGLSDPEPDFSDPADVAANLWRKKDADFVKTLAGRAALRWMPSDVLDLNLTYYYQDMESGGRTMNNIDAFGTGRYESAMRYLEPNDRRNELGVLELTADLGFAELTSATGASRYQEDGQRDQTDLLIGLEYSYEAFPTFSAYTHEVQEDRTFTQELRLVSTSSGPLSWIVGAFYNHLESDGASSEFTPHYDEYLLTFGFPGVPRPDALEYYSVSLTKQREEAVYGELSYDITDRWQATVGARWYDYRLRIQSATSLPLWDTVNGDLAPDDLGIGEMDELTQKDAGTLFKFNTSFKVTDDVLAYVTVSEGYRIGGANGVGVCEDPVGNAQSVCGMPADHSQNVSGVTELEFAPDKTTNYEVGLRTAWLGGSLIANGSIYYIDWEDPQLASATEFGNQPITLNGKGARTQGFEFNFDAALTDRLSLRASYAYTDAELTDTAIRLNRTVEPPGFGSVYVNGEDGDRLPGSPEHQGTAFLKYQMPLGGFDLDLSYGVSAIGGVLTRAGERADGEEMGGYALHSAAASLRADAWTMTLYANNLFNKYAVTGIRSNRANIQTVADENGEPVAVRSYFKYVTRPREVGLRFTYDFDL